MANWLLIQIQRGAQNADREMRQMRSVVVELNPTNHAVLFQILSDFGFADSQMLGEFCFQPAVGDRTALTRRLGRAASRASCQISEADAQGLARFNVIR